MPPNAIDFHLSPTRNTDKAPTYAAALADLKKDGVCPEDALHRQVEYRNKVVETERGKLKRRTPGFKQPTRQSSASR